MILIFGGLADPVTELICARLEYQSRSYRLVDLAYYPQRYRVAWTWEYGTPHGSIHGLDWSCDLDEIEGVFARLLGGEGHAPLVDIPQALEYAVFIESEAGLTTLLEALPCPVVNRPANASANNSKPYQELLIRQYGLNIPQTLITSDPNEARTFYENCAGEVIFKSLSGIRSIVRRMEAHDLIRLQSLRQNVVQFQRYVPGDNVRVHVVGDQLFATRIHSDAVDYRYAHLQQAQVEMEPTSLPEWVADACLRLAQTSHLLLAGIDLKETPDGEWYCFEINPMPGFSFVELRTAQPISEALVALFGQRRACQTIRRRLT